MQIYLLRHGSAGPAPPGAPDSSRSLTAEGEAQVRAVARRTLTRMSDLAILSSPYKRAIHTAQIAANEAGVSRPILEVGALTPDSSPAEAWNEVKLHCSGNGPVLLVGHEPLFSSLTAYLLGAPDLALEFGTATLACVEMPSGISRPRGSLKWLMPAKLA